MFRDVRIPGVVWAVALIVIVAVVHENEVAIEAQYGIDPFFVDLIIAMLIGVLKSISLGTEQLNAALDIIEKILARRHDETMRAAGDEVKVDQIPERPNPMVRWLFG